MLIKLDKLFDVKYGINLELNKCTIDKNGINFVSRTFQNNGVSAKVKKINNVEPQPAGTITVSGGGSTCEAFLQLEEFYSGRDLYVLYPKFKMSVEIGIFYTMCIRFNKYRFNYGRQANRTLKDLLIPDHKNYNEWVKNSLDHSKKKVSSNLKIIEEFILL
tara:strand:- start:259 stop:741 length:483 start_codon:yes stop_codon:yes gene_type:complete